jgi:uncharacterized protein (DUF433 family)
VRARNAARGARATAAPGKLATEVTQSRYDTGRAAAGAGGHDRTYRTERRGAVSAPYQAIITLEPGKRSGRPTIRGMRITVYDLHSYLAAGLTQREILDDFHHLTEEVIRACSSFAADRERWRRARQITAV